MIRHISAQSVNAALHDGLYHLAYHGIEEPSRNGPVIVSSMPVITTYLHPERRVLVNSKRDANPFFHLFEALWMLAGRNDVAFCAKFASNLANYSDDKETLHGAYGYRWRNFFGEDQLALIIQHLKDDPKTRRAVLQMWDGGRTGYEEEGKGDLESAIAGGLDVPCNTAAYFDTIGGKLNMLVTCRSNDIIWGAYGANAVHFSILLEYMAVMTGIPMGVYRQLSNNFHAYASIVTKEQMPGYADSVIGTDIYGTPGPMKTKLYEDCPIRGVPLMDPDTEQAWHDDLIIFMGLVDAGSAGIGDNPFTTNFFRKVVGPMYDTWARWKAKDFEAARQRALTIVADDWRLAAQDWLSVRELRRKEKES